MTVFVSNLIAGMEHALDHPGLLLDMVKPFNGKVGIEFFVHTYSEEYMERMDQIPRWIGNLPAALHGPFRFTEATSPPDSKEFITLTGAYEQAFRLARQLGCTHVVFHSNECFIHPEDKQRLQSQCLSNIAILIRQARPYGVRLLLENLALPSKGTPLFDTQEYIALFDRFPEADCLIDAGHLAVANWDMEAVISALAPRIKGYHLHNNDGIHDSHERIVNGVIDYEHFFRLYRMYTPSADLTLEYGDDHHITAEDVHRDIAYVLELAQG